MKTLMPVLLVSLAAALLAPVNTKADGMFVAPKFVWDKHKDINEPTQKAILVYDAGREDLILQVKYEGPVDEFGWLIPVPSLPTVQEGSMKCFYELSKFTQQRLEPQWGMALLSARSKGGEDSKGNPEPPVKVIEIKTTGAYKITVLSTRDTGALQRWLAENQFYLPTSQAGVLDSYVQQKWYFVAVRINLGHWGWKTPATSGKLASGELNPLQISFASDRCVFPLKISSVNGRPSEIQVYVLSPKPLLERGMLEKQLPGIYSNDLARAEENAARWEQSQIRMRNMRIGITGETESVAAPLSPEAQRQIQRMSETPVANPGNLPPYTKVAKTDLPDTSQRIPRLADKSWWLTKQTWTFQPQEMRDLDFEPALDVFANWLGTKYGYFAVAGLARFETDAAPTLLAALQNTNPVVRVNAASLFSRPYGTFSDPRITEAAVSWLKDSQPEVRLAGLTVLTDYGHWNPKMAETLVTTLRDKDAGVRHQAIFALPRFRADMERFVPEFRAMLNDNDPAIQSAGMQILQRLGMVIPREALLRLFNSSDSETLAWVNQQLMRQDEKISDEEAMGLLQNPEAMGRQLGLRILARNPEKQSVELALPLLRDPDEIVRLQAVQTLHALTGQMFSEDQASEWSKWWMQNKTHFVAQTLPDRSRGLPDGEAYHMRGCQYYNRRTFTESLGDFRKSCQLGSDAQDYSYYRIWIIRARSGEEEAATKELASYLKDRKPHNPPDWPLQIGRFLNGQITEAELLNAAVNANSRTNREQHCEAYFYAGSKRLVENDTAGAVDLFKKCLGTAVTDFEEYDSAQAELKALP
jgi:HEAT repeat protein